VHPVALLDATVSTEDCPTAIAAGLAVIEAVGWAGGGGGVLVEVRFPPQPKSCSATKIPNTKTIAFDSNLLRLSMVFLLFLVSILNPIVGKISPFDYF
jgi:hypothetical protein